MKKNRTVIGWVIGLGLMLALFLNAGPSFFRILAQVNLWYLLLALLLTGVVLYATTYRWAMIVRPLVGAASPSLADMLRYTLTGAAVGVFVPRDVGEMSARITSMKLNHQAGLKTVTFSVFFDRFFDVLVLIPFAAAALPFLSGHVTSTRTLLTLDVVCLVLFAALLSFGRTHKVMFGGIRAAYVPVYALSRRLPLLQRLRLPEPVVIGSLPQVLSRRVVVGAFCWTVCKFLALVLKTYMISSALHLDISFVAVFLAMPLAEASLMLAFTPGGLGIGELGWYAALVLCGADPAAVVPFLLGRRILNYVLLLVLMVLAQVVQLALGIGKRVPVVRNESS